MGDGDIIQGGDPIIKIQKLTTKDDLDKSLVVHHEDWHQNL